MFGGDLPHSRDTKEFWRGMMENTAHLIKPAEKPANTRGPKTSPVYPAANTN